MSGDPNLQTFQSGPSRSGGIMMLQRPQLMIQLSYLWILTVSMDSQREEKRVLIQIRSTYKLTYWTKLGYSPQLT